MSFKQVIELADLLDDGRVTGEDVVKYVTAEGNVKATCTTVTGAKGSTDFVKFLIPGKNGKTKGGTAPTLGIVGRLGGLGARPERIGFTSDGDGALAASAIAAKLARMTVRGDELEGDVIVGTHICPDAPTLPHKPAPFMDSPVTMDVLNKEEIDPAMDAILSIDTTKGNQIICHNGIAITTETVVPGCGTGATHLVDVDDAVRYSIEVAKAFTQNECSFYDKKEFELITKLYGSMTHFQGSGQH